MLGAGRGTSMLFECAWLRGRLEFIFSYFQRAWKVHADTRRVTVRGGEQGQVIYVSFSGFVLKR